MKTGKLKMSARDDLTIVDLRNALDWYRNSTASKHHNEEHARSKIKIQGLLAINEDHSEPLVDDLIGTILSGLDTASKHDLQYARSLLVHRIAKVESEKQSLKHLLSKVDEQLGDSKNE